MNTTLPFCKHFPHTSNGYRIKKQTPNHYTTYRKKQHDRLIKVVSKDSVFISDNHHSYKMLCRKERIEHVIIESELHVAGAYSLSRINSLHSSIERFLGSKEYLPATKYIDLYLKMFWWLQKNKDCSTKEMTDKLFRIMTGHVDNSDRAKMSRVTVNSLVSRKMPIDTKGFY